MAKDLVKGSTPRSKSGARATGAVTPPVVSAAASEPKKPFNPGQFTKEVRAEAKRITNFEGKRRQMQFIGKLMRKLDEATVAAIEEALKVQHQGSAKDTLRLHQAEQWRDRLIANDEALEAWLKLDPDTDLQHLRTLVRQFDD